MFHPKYHKLGANLDSFLFHSGTQLVTKFHQLYFQNIFQIHLLLCSPSATLLVQATITSLPVQQLNPSTSPHNLSTPPIVHASMVHIAAREISIWLSNSPY